MDGRLECTGLNVSPTNDSAAEVLTAATLRKIPLGALVEELWKRRADTLADAAGRHRPDPASGTYVPVFTTGDVHKPRVGRPPKYSDEHYRNVADLYDAAFLARRSPVKEVADQFWVKHSTAAKWVATCRVRGLLPPTEPGRARARTRDQA